MGLWSKVRAEFATRSASHYIAKWMNTALATDDLAPTGDLRKLGEALVVQLRANVPALQQSSANPRPVIIAAAALAYGVRYFDSIGRRAMSDRLFPSLRIGMTYEVCKLDVAEFSEVEGELFDLAGSVFDKPVPDTSSISAALRDIIEAHDEHKEPPRTHSQPNPTGATIAPWKAQFFDRSFLVGPSVPKINTRVPASACQCGPLYIAFYKDPPSAPYRCHFAASVYDTAAQRILCIFTLEESFGGGAFFCAFERDGVRVNLGESQTSFDAFKGAVLDSACRRSGLQRSTVEEAAV